MRFLSRIRSALGVKIALMQNGYMIVEHDLIRIRSTGVSILRGIDYNNTDKPIYIDLVYVTKSSGNITVLIGSLFIAILRRRPYIYVQRV